jgi:hypothetical protein
VYVVSTPWAWCRTPDVYRGSPAGFEFIRPCPPAGTNAVHRRQISRGGAAQGTDWWLERDDQQTGRTVEVSLNFLGAGAASLRGEDGGASPTA